MDSAATALTIIEVSKEQVSACYPLMRQLRPHLSSPSEFIAQWRRQSAQGYRLVALWQDAQPVGLAGYRLTESLIHGCFLYVDDLVVDGEQRNAGHGALLMDWLQEQGKRNGCTKLVLDTGLDNVLGHRFYYRQGLLAMALRFAKALG